jgi:hypothetical protein
LKRDATVPLDSDRIAAGRADSRLAVVRIVGEMKLTAMAAGAAIDVEHFNRSWRYELSHT